MHGIRVRDHSPLVFWVCFWGRYLLDFEMLRATFQNPGSQESAATARGTLFKDARKLIALRKALEEEEARLSTAHLDSIRAKR
jgi:hypothetical protein